MKLLTSGIYTFEKLIKDNYLYVDKTEYIWDLISQPTGLYFLSRPRRFGKSLTVSTLETVFNGKKELFKGLSIYNKDYDWKKYPVIHLDFADTDADSPAALKEDISERLQKIADNYKVPLKGKTIQSQFRQLIYKLSEKNPVVILVDEYDKPILGNVSNPKVKEILKVLKGFYSVIKGTEGKQRFVLLTGVSKFAHVSVFSDLNNLTDITYDSDYAAMLGYTQEEFEDNFAEYIDQVAKQQNIPRQELLDKLKQWYDGYCFHANGPLVYNPVSVAQFFLKKGEFRSYWFATGTPSFLLELAQKTQFDFEQALTEPVSGLVFDSFEIDNLNPLALLLQTGYLTIKGTEEDFGVTLYYLGFPNDEVKSSFDAYLLNYYTKVPKENIEELSVRLARLVRSGEVDAFMELLKTFFAQIPYDIKLRNEKYYQTIFFMLFLLLGVHIEAEARTNNGRIDAVASYGEWTYLLEFKLNKNAKTALNQIKDKEYFRKYLHTGKRIIMIGVNFDSKSGQIKDWQKEELV